jgi:hypothetical protein
MAQTPTTASAMEGMEVPPHPESQPASARYLRNERPTMGEFAQGILADRRLQTPRRRNAQRLLDHTRPAGILRALPPLPGRQANRRMRTPTSGGVGGARVSLAPTRSNSRRLLEVLAGCRRSVARWDAEASGPSHPLVRKLGAFQTITPVTPRMFKVPCTQVLSRALGVRKQVRKSTSRQVLASAASGTIVRIAWCLSCPRRPVRGRPVPGYRVNPEQEGGVWSPQPS